MTSQVSANIRKKEQEELDKHHRLKEKLEPKRRRDPVLNPHGGGELGLEGVRVLPLPAITALFSLGSHAVYTPVAAPLLAFEGS